MVNILTVKASAGSSISWLGVAVAAVVSVVVSVTTAWLTFELVKRREMAEGLRLEVKKLDLITKPQLAETLRNEIERQRETIRLEQEKEKDERIRQEVIRWANPILGAVKDLHGRLDNILRQGGYLALRPEYKESSQWSISYDYFIRSTLYLFGAYFAYTEALVDELNFELFRDQEEKENLFQALASVGRALGSFPPAYRCSGMDRQVFHLEQSSMGSALLRRDDDRVRCISYPDFLEKLDNEKTSLIFSPMRKLLENLEPNSDNCRWKRIEATDGALAEVDAVCQRILSLSRK